MKATVIYGAGDVRVEDVPDASIKVPTDAVVRVVHSCVCGGDLWPYGSMPHSDEGRRMGHEFIGVVEDVGSDALGVKSGGMVVAPFVWADNTCDFPTCSRARSSRAGCSTWRLTSKRYLRDIGRWPTAKR